MTEQQLERLPPLMRAIIEVDHELIAIRRSDVPDFEAFRDARERRVYYRRAATRLWGHTLRGGPANEA